MNYWIMLLILKSVGLSGYEAAASTIYTHGMAECPRFWSRLFVYQVCGVWEDKIAGHIGI